jgi:hypothetical protein
VCSSDLGAPAFPSMLASLVAVRLASPPPSELALASEARDGLGFFCPGSLPLMKRKKRKQKGVFG